MQVTFAPTGTWLASTDDLQIGYWWDIVAAIGLPARAYDPERRHGRVYAAAGELLIPEILPLARRPRCVAISPDSRTVAFGASRTIRRFDLTRWRRIDPLPGPSRVRRLAYLPEGRLLAAYDDRHVRTWDGARCAAGKDRQLGPLAALAVARAGMRAAVGSHTGTILVWDLD